VLWRNNERDFGRKSERNLGEQKVTANINQSKEQMGIPICSFALFPATLTFMVYYGKIIITTKGVKKWILIR
jgi:hypothetical protein